MSKLKDILSVSEKARIAWAKETSALDEVNLAFELLDLVLSECKSTHVFKDDIQRDTDFRACIVAIIRCAVHYYLHAQAGCFDDARIFQRKAMEFIAVCIGIGYDDDLYEKWKNEEFTRPGRGCASLCKSIKNSPYVPIEEKKIAFWIIGEHERSDGISQYHLLSNEVVHGLSCKTLRSQIKPDSSFKMDISEIIPSEIRTKIHVVRNLLMTCSSISIGVFKYKEHVFKTGNSSVSNKILEWYKRLQELAKDDML